MLAWLLGVVVIALFLFVVAVVEKRYQLEQSILVWSLFYAIAKISKN